MARPLRGLRRRTAETPVGALPAPQTPGRVVPGGVNVTPAGLSTWAGSGERRSSSWVPSSCLAVTRPAPPGRRNTAAPTPGQGVGAVRGPTLWCMDALGIATRATTDDTTMELISERLAWALQLRREAMAERFGVMSISICTDRNTGERTVRSFGVVVNGSPRRSAWTAPPAGTRRARMPVRVPVCVTWTPRRGSAFRSCRRRGSAPSC